MLEQLKDDVLQANLALVKHGLVIFTWGNVSGIDRDRGMVVIKPSGVSYDAMKVSDMVVVSLDSGKVVEGALNPSSDTPTHLELYKAFSALGGVAHTHSTYATAWAQSQRGIPMAGTTHADYFNGEIPCTREMTKEEIESEYEKRTGKVIVETLNGGNALHMPAILVSNHGPFTWGATPAMAVESSVLLEEVARMALLTSLLNPLMPMNELLAGKHFERKHGDGAYYGQKRSTR